MCTFIRLGVVGAKFDCAGMVFTTFSAATIAKIAWDSSRTATGELQ